MVRCRAACFFLSLPLTAAARRRARVPDVPPERQRLVFAGHILSPDDKELARVPVRLRASTCRRGLLAPA